MTAWMPPSEQNPRKRQASATPLMHNRAPNPTSNFIAGHQASTPDYMWPQGSVDNKMHTGMNYNMAAYGGNGYTGPTFNQPLPGQSTQLARRPNQHLVQKNSFHDPNEWALTDNSYFDSKQNDGGSSENESIERLEERAAAAKREAQSKRKQIPPFVQKLNSFLDDGKNTDLIRWSDRGDSFVVLDEDEFAKTLIPELFKHNNYASFVRQLNMYGFHKRVGLSDNSMKASERKNKSPSEYYNPYFKRGHPNLLWLINKPKNPGKKTKARAKQEDGGDESDDDNKEPIEEVYGYGQDHRPRAISAVPDSGQAGPVALTHVQKQLRDIQLQQNNISSMINQLRQTNQDLYQKAEHFSKLHHRHENSINAILTFLATIYNRSLDTNNAPQDLMRVFASLGHTMPQEMPQGNVVDLENVPQGSTNGNTSPMRRPPKMLMAPPSQYSQSQSSRSQSGSTASTPFAMHGSGSSNIGRASLTPQPGAIEEVFDTSPSGRSPEATSDIPDATAQRTTPRPNSQQLPQGDILDLINKTNANVPRQKDMPFPDALHHFENANGNSPLSAHQRNEMLQLIASTTGSNAGIQALSSPSPLPLNQIQYNQEELDRLSRLQQEQDHKIGEVSNLLGPLTPSGQIPGIDPASNSYFGNGDVSPLGGANLDLDQFLDAGAYYNADVDATGYDNYNGFPDDAMAPGLDFSMAQGGIGMDGAMDTASPGGSNTDTPNSTNMNDVGSKQSGEGSPKRRRIG